jgi:hypothetical protein
LLAAGRCRVRLLTAATLGALDGTRLRRVGSQWTALTHATAARVESGVAQLATGTRGIGLRSGRTLGAFACSCAGRHQGQWALQTLRAVGRVEARLAEVATVLCCIGFAAAQTLDALGGSGIRGNLADGTLLALPTSR